MVIYVHSGHVCASQVLNCSVPMNTYTNWIRSYPGNQRYIHVHLCTGIHVHVCTGIHVHVHVIGSEYRVGTFHVHVQYTRDTYIVQHTSCYFSGEVQLIQQVRFPMVLSDQNLSFIPFYLSPSVFSPSWWHSCAVLTVDRRTSSVARGGWFGIGPYSSSMV